jgi:hypothetical protein
MNTELYSLMWYTRADIIRMRNRNSIVHRKEHANCEAVVNSVADDMKSEVTALLSGIARTLDDTIDSRRLANNTLFLAHLIQAFTVHLYALTSCRDAYDKLGLSLLSLDNNFVRVCCHVETVMDICKANLAILCRNPTLPGRRTSSTKATTFIGVPAGATKRASSDPSTINRSNSPVSSKTDTSKLIETLEKPVYNPAMKDLLVQHGRLSRNLSSKGLINAHKAAHSAMCDMVSGVTANQAM